MSILQKPGYRVIQKGGGPVANNDQYICDYHSDCGYQTGHFDLLVLHIRGIERPSYNPEGKNPQQQLDHYYIMCRGKINRFVMNKIRDAECTYCLKRYSINNKRTI